MSQWCVIAHNSDGEYWAYGPFEHQSDAEELAERLQAAPLGDEIEYEVGDLFNGKEM